jgi:ribosomal subunit interface protein
VDVVVRCRHTEVSDRFRQHVTERLGKLARLDSRVIRIDVEVSHEPNPRLSDARERVELTCRSKGPVIRAEAAASDAFAAADLACSKLEERLRRAADRRRVHHGTRTPVSVAAALRTDATTPPPAAQPAADARSPAAGGTADGASADASAELGAPEDGPLVVREKTHVSDPMTLDQALHEMELVGHDFYLFRDKDTSRPSVVYRRRGYSYGVIRLDSKTQTSDGWDTTVPS